MDKNSYCVFPALSVKYTGKTDYKPIRADCNRDSILWRIRKDAIPHRTPANAAIGPGQFFVFWLQSRSLWVFTMKDSLICAGLYCFSLFGH